MTDSRHPLVYALLLTAGLLWTVQASAALPADVAAFASEVAGRHGLEREAVAALLSRADNLVDDIRPRFQGSAERNWTWKKYRKHFLSDYRINNGVRFWSEHEAIFQRASERFGIPASILAAIVGVETNYGRNTGKIRVLDSLYTQAFHYPERRRFGQRELEAFIALSFQENLNPLTVKGSYAGAMGKPQFIPTSYSHYAVDFDADGRRDLWNSTADIIGSVANYFAAHRWKRGEPVLFRIDKAKPNYRELAIGETEKPLPPDLSLADLAEHGIALPREWDREMPGRLIEYNGVNGREYWVGLHNFYVITRYNHSNLYAMAVFQLSRAILAARNQADSQKS